MVRAVMMELVILIKYYTYQLCVLVMFSHSLLEYPFLNLKPECAWLRLSDSKIK